MINSVNFNEVVDFLEGPGVRKWQFRDSGIKLINIRNLVESKLDLSNTNKHLDESEVSQKYSHFLLKNGDYVMASSGVTWGKIAEVKEEHLPLCLNTSIIKLKPKNNNLEKRFLWYFIKARVFRKQIDRIITGSAQPNFGPSHLHKISIPLPPLDQQKKIAAILDAADAYKQKTKTLIEKYDELSQSLFLEMFGDPVTNPKGWEIKTIGDCFNVKGGKRLPKGSEYETTVTKHAYIRVKDFMANGLDTSDIKYISEEIHDKISRYIISSNDVYISIAGTIGLSGYVPESLSGANLTENAAKLIPKEAIEFRKEYLSFYLNSDYAQQNIKSKTMAVGVPKLALFRIQELPYINAPINVQDIFVRRVQAIESQKAQAQASLAQAEDLFNSLLQRAFKGELIKNYIL